MEARRDDALVRALRATLIGLPIVISFVVGLVYVPVVLVIGALVAASFVVGLVIRNAYEVWRDGRK